MTGVDAVVFDLGNVLVRWDPTRAFVGVRTEAEIARFFHEVDFLALNERQDAGRTWAEARAEIAERRPEHVATLDLYVERFPQTLTGPVPGTAEIVDDLRSAGVRVLGLTIWSAETFHHAEPAAPVVGRLEGVVVSGREGIVKPDPRIFRLLLDRRRLAPERTVVVDDTLPNALGAWAVGLQAVRFTDARALRADLVRRGALPPPSSRPEYAADRPG